MKNIAQYKINIFIKLIPWNLVITNFSKYRNIDLLRPIADKILTVRYSNPLDLLKNDILYSKSLISSDVKKETFKENETIEPILYIEN